MEITFDEVWKRVSKELGWTKLKEMNEFLGFSPSAASLQKKRGNFPIDWAFAIAQGHGLSTDWILTGKGPRYLNQLSNENISEPSVTYANETKILPVTDTNQHLKHQTDFVQEVVKHVLTNHEIKPPKSLTRQELEMLFIFKKVKEDPEIFEGFEQVILEYMIRAIHQEKGMYDYNSEEFLKDPYDLSQY